MLLQQIYILVFGTLADLFCFALLARFAFQWARAPFRNPVGRFLTAVTDWAVLPARRLIPGFFGLDMASLFLAWLIQALYLGVLFGLTGMAAAASLEAIGVVALAAAFEVLRVGIYLAMGLVIVAAVMSWINPYAPLAPLFSALAAPLLRPFQRLIPPIGGVDLSPLALLLVLQVLLAVLANVEGLFLPRVIH